MKYEVAKSNTASLLTAAKKAEYEARIAGFGDDTLNTEAKAAIGRWRSAKNVESSLSKKTKIGPYNQVGYLIALCIILAIFFGIGMKVMGTSIGRFILGFAFVFLIAVLAYMMPNPACS